MVQILVVIHLDLQILAMLDMQKLDLERLLDILEVQLVQLQVM